MKKSIFYALLLGSAALGGCSEQLEADVFGLSAHAVDFTAEGGEKNIVMNTACDCELSCSDSWVTLSAQYIETGRSELTITAEPNPTFDSRQTIVAIVNDEFGVSGQIAVRQAGIVPSIDCDTSLDATIEGGTFSIEVSSTVPWEASTDADWLTLWPAAGQAGTSILSVGISSLLSGASRHGEIVLTNTEHKVTRKIKVKQDGLSQTEIAHTITYTTNDDNPISTSDFDSAFDATIITHIFDNGTGMLIFDKPITCIGDRAFYSCNSLTSITIPDSVTEIGNYAFYGSSLTSITIPNGVTSIGNCAFDTCRSLTDITIPDSVTSIGNCAFQCCSRLKSITIPDSVTSIEVGTFSNCISLTSVTIGNSVTSIGDSAFFNCSCLTSITIPDSVTTIETYAFSNCNSLTSITIPDGVTSIERYAFQHCSSLTSITIPDGVTSIGYCAFFDCSSLTNIYCKPTVPPSIDFYSIPSSVQRIYVPRASVEAYKNAAYWKEYASIIVGYDF